MLFDLFDMTTGDSSEDGLGLCQGYANQNDCSLCVAPPWVVLTFWGTDSWPLTWHYCAAIWSQAGYVHKLNQMLVEHDPAVCRPSSKLQSFARRCGVVQCCSTASVHTVHTLYVLPDPVAKLLLLPSSNSQALAFGQLPRQSERILWFGVEFYWVPTVNSYNVRPPLCSNTIFHHFSMILQHTWLHMITPYYNSLVTRF